MNRLFTWARIKLTVVYLVIIMIISLLFNAVIYNGVSRELRVRFVAIEQRFEDLNIARQMKLHEVLLEDLKNAERSLLLILIYTDAIIFVASAVAGFIMAGKTLKPIEEALEEQKRFVADASHELRTPLTALKTNIEVTLRDKKLTLKESKKVLEQNLIEVNKMRDLAAGLLTMARITQYEDLTTSNVDLKKLVESVIKAMKPMAIQKELKLSSELKSVEARVDPDSIEKLIRILLDNAIKYTAKGKVTIKLHKYKKEAVITVSDTGTGIESKDLDNIFDRFYRAEASRTTQYSSGFGLGLSLAQQIVDAHGGRIEVKSKINNGTTFTVYLPL